MYSTAVFITCALRIVIFISLLLTESMCNFSLTICLQCFTYSLSKQKLKVQHKISGQETTTELYSTKSNIPYDGIK